MKKTSAILLSAVLLAGCANDQQAGGPPAIPADAKFVEAKDPAITAQTRYAAGQLSESSEKFDNAISQYNEALKIDPNHEPSLYRLGVVYAQVKDFPKAIETWQKYITVTKDDATGYGNLGFCQELSGNVEEAEAAYKKGISHDAKNETCRVNYGLMLARLGRVNEAFTQFSAVLPPAAAHYNIGSVYEQQKKLAQAKLEYTRALECDPTFFDAQQRLASINE